MLDSLPSCAGGALCESPSPRAVEGAAGLRPPPMVRLGYGGDTPVQPVGSVFGLQSDDDVVAGGVVTVESVPVAVGGCSGTVVFGELVVVGGGVVTVTVVVDGGGGGTVCVTVVVDGGGDGTVVFGELVVVGGGCGVGDGGVVVVTTVVVAEGGVDGQVTFESDFALDAALAYAEARALF